VLSKITLHLLTQIWVTKSFGKNALLLPICWLKY